MKGLKRVLCIGLIAAFALSAAACGGGSNRNDAVDMGYEVVDGGYVYPSGGYGYSGKSGVGKGAIATADGYAAREGVDGGVEIDGDVVEVIEPDINYRAGLITASAHNDNYYYEMWKSLFLKGQTEEENGRLFGFTGENNWGLNSTERVTVMVNDGEKPVAYATVYAVDEEGNNLFSAKTDASGKAYLFPNKAAKRIIAKSGDFSAEKELDGESLVITLGGSEKKADRIELMFVVDVTGSMGDEIRYLTKELEDVITRVQAHFGQTTEIDLGFVFYRDHEDPVLLDKYPLINVSETQNLEKVKKVVAAQSASGGGDYEEAVEEALMAAVDEQWTDGTSTKIIFQILDAPPHGNEENVSVFNAAVLKAAEKGIRVCPIICSGADTLCEYVMRQAAVYTGGTFVYVTDDSGIGGAHHDPEIPNDVVERLNDLMVRLIKGYHSGQFEEPVDWKTLEKEEEQNANDGQKG